MCPFLHRSRNTEISPILWWLGSTSSNHVCVSTVPPAPTLIIICDINDSFCRNQLIFAFRKTSSPAVFRVPNPAAGAVTYRYERGDGPGLGGGGKKDPFFLNSGEK